MPSFDQTTLAIVQAVAAVVQAATALAIVWLTLRLTATARSALLASEAQADAARNSTAEMRRQAQLEAIPLLNVERPTYIYGGDLELNLYLENPSTQAALGVAISIFAEHERGRAELNARLTRSKIPLLPPGGQMMLTLNAHELQNFGSHDQAGMPTPMFTNDWLLIVLEFAGLRGARVRERYEWHANFQDQSEPSIWHLMDVAYSPDGDPANEVEVRP